jgi:hypothetical protein
MYLTGIDRIFQPTSTEYIFFEATPEIDHILGHRASFNKYRKTEIISYFLYIIME